MQLPDISNKLSQQSDEVSALREEFRGNSVSVGKEVKKLKTDIDVQWKRQGNKVQYTFNADIIDNFMSQACWALANDKVSYCKDVLSEGIDKLKHRQKLTRIADSSEGGWDTVNCYESNPLASDSDDETKLRKAETQALKKRKNKSVKHLHSARKTPSATVTSGALYGYPAYRGFQPDAYRQQAPRGRGSFRGFYGNVPDPVSRSVPVTPVGNTTTSGDNVRTPPVPPSSRPTPQPPRNDVAQGTSTVED
ncbi:uncharacterized protein LOC128234346 [Mya arenaria]|uniref:uncharacterized protein LOC128234346 n=1 Tax=Mya arenaria TaxID=6604 RepID=UPI0022E34361|nr:uncharacterized protein LOC128234346 [Mya arenaria]